MVNTPFAGSVIQLRVLVVTALLAVCMPRMSQGATHVAVMLGSGDGVPVVDLQVRTDRATLAFRDADRAVAATLRGRLWQVAGDCHVLAGDVLERKRPSCDVVRVAIRSETTRIDRTYPPALPFADGGVLLHLPHIVPAGHAAGDSVTLLPPPGGVVIWRGRVHRGAVSFDAAAWDENTYAYIGPAPAHRWDGAPVVIDPGVPPCVADAAQRTVVSARAGLARLAGRPGPADIALFLQADPRARTAATRFDGDVAQGGMIRLSFSGGEGACDALVPQVARFVAHEMVHLWHPNAEGDASWLKEGLAEFFGLLLAVQAGQLPLQAASQRIEEAFNACLSSVGTRDWAVAVDGPGHLRYDCGLVLVFALALDRPPRTGDAAWMALFDGRPPLDAAALLDAVAPRALPWPTLPGAALPAAEDDALRRWKALLGSHAARVEIDPSPARHEGVLMARTVLSALILEQCGAGFDLALADTGLRASGPRHCPSLGRSQVVVAIDGVALRTGMAAAARAGMRRCSVAEHVAVTDDRGFHHLVRCGDARRASVTSVLRLDASAAVAMLARTAFPH